MRFPSILFALFFLLICSCKEDEEKEGIEERNEIVEIKSLTNTEAIKDFLEESETADPELYRAEAVSEFYKENEYQPIWTTRELREDLFRNIEEIEKEGLFFEDYHGEILFKLLSSLDSNSESENNSVEILLTDAFLRLADDLGTGKLDPTKIYEIWGTPLNKVNASELLKKALSEENITEVLNSVKPNHIVYQGLKRSLKEYKETGVMENYATIIPSGPLIRPGETDDRINLVANRLSELGYFKKNLDSVEPIYNKDIQEAVKAFQQDHGLQVDALLGNTTISNLNLSKEDRYHQILVNLERWRWYPRDLGDHYIIINIPNYKLSVIKNGDTISSHKTMVGTQVRKTPVFSDEIGYIIYNPTWTIPPTIKKNDVIPGASRDINYLKKKNIKIYDGSGSIVDPSEVDWGSSKAKSYTYRQPAGASNPLGVVKIIYPNEYMIYLHDTPSKSLFENNARAQSSGCVRVQNALELAEYLLSDQKKYDRDKIDEILKSGKTTQIAVTQKVRVHHFYWTAYQKKDTTKFIDDIYNLDQKLWEIFKPQS
ncbi:MAG: L,D-transpeptidase family protein [Christiangramia sp.]